METWHDIVKREETIGRTLLVALRLRKCDKFGDSPPYASAFTLRFARQGEQKQKTLQERKSYTIRIH